MSLSNTNALISIQEGAGAANNVASGATATVTAGSKLTFALQSTTGVARWTLSFKASNFPALDNYTVDWFQGMANAITVILPNDAVNLNSVVQGIEFVSTVSDGSASIGSVIGFIQTRSASAIPFQHQVRACIPAALGAYTNVNGVLTENAANGAIGAQDGVTLVAGDLVLLPNGVAASAVDAGVYQVTNPGSGSAKWVLTLAPEWTTGAAVPPKTEVLVSEGTLYSNTTWVVTNTGQANLVGTASFTFYPRIVSQSVTLTTGFKTITNVPIFSTASAIVFQPTNFSGASTTVSYRNGVYASGGAATVTGALGTCSASITALVAAGTFNTNDVGTGTMTVINQV